MYLYNEGYSYSTNPTFLQFIDSNQDNLALGISENYGGEGTRYTISYSGSTNNNDVPIEFIGMGSPVIGEWLHIVWTSNVNPAHWDASVVSLYINNSVIGTFPRGDDGNLRYNPEWMRIIYPHINPIGVNWVGGNHFHGKMAYLRIWNGHSLTTSEVTELYNNRSNRLSYYNPDNSTLQTYTAPPVVNINGDENISIFVDGTYTDEGATVTTFDGNTYTVYSSDSWNANIAGTYTIQYTYTDSNYRTGNDFRYITVVENPVVNLSWNQIYSPNTNGNITLLYSSPQVFIIGGGGTRNGRYDENSHANPTVYSVDGNAFFHMRAFLFRFYFSTPVQLHTFSFGTSSAHQYTTIYEWQIRAKPFDENVFHVLAHSNGGTSATFTDTRYFTDVVFCIIRVNPNQARAFRFNSASFTGRQQV